MAYSGKENGVETIESRNMSKPTRGGRVKRHCAKWWWLHLLIVIVVALAITLGIIFGAIPHIGQKTINESTLEVDAISISQPTNQNFTFGINSTIHGSVPVASHLGPQQLAMFLRHDNGTNGNPFMYLNISQLDLHDTIPVNIFNYPMQIVDQAAFNEFTGVVLGSESFKMGVHSRPQLYVGSIHNAVTYDKTVELKGFNALAGVTLSNVSLLSTADADGTNMLTNCLIPNPSVFTLDMGNLTMNFAMGSLHLGYGVVQNLVLHPGDNHVQVRAVLPDNLVASPILLNATLASGAPITLTGNSTIYNGVHIEWLETPINALSLNVSSPGPLAS